MSTAIIFPGQGAQAVGMGRELAESSPACKALFNEASEVLGYDLAAVCFEGPAEELTRSDRAQPAIFVVSAAAYTALREQKGDLSFDAVAGLSSGEWCALYAAGVVSYSDALKVLEARGRFMQEACEATRGSMISVMGLDLETLQGICDQTGLEIANLNSPEQTVLSGPADAVPAAESLAKEAGAKRAIPLQVAGAFHSSLMQPAAEKFGEFLSGIEFSVPSVPVVANINGQPHGGADAIRQAMVDQVTGSVQWVSTINWMAEQGVNCYVECGPGRVLSGLIKRIDKQASLHNIQDASSLEKTVSSL